MELFFSLLSKQIPEKYCFIAFVGWGAEEQIEKTRPPFFARTLEHNSLKSIELLWQKP